MPLLKKRHIKARKEFCHKYSAWTNKKWGTVLWTDESKFNIFGSDGKQFVRRPSNKEFDPHYTKKHLNLAVEALWCGDVSRHLVLVLSI